MLLLERLRYWAEKTPDKVALYNGNLKEDIALTYGELELYSNRLAGIIKNQSPKGEAKRPIVVYGHKNPYMIVAFLACVKAGFAYCPVDISSPTERLLDIVKEAGSHLVLALEDLPDNVTLSSKILSLEEIKGLCQDGENQKEVIHIDGENTFYILFTSGSTGKPKGVEITYGCLNNFLLWMSSVVEKNGISHPDFINQAPFSFDLSVMDLYTNLYMGGTLNMLSKDVQMDFSSLYENLANSHSTVWVSTPSFADMCLSDRQFSQDLMKDLRLFLFCGEVLTRETAERLLERFPQASIVNTYGPTESTVAVTEVKITKELLAEDKPLPIGKAKEGTEIEIWSEQEECAKANEPGEIIILGNTVAKGYFHMKEETEKRFLALERGGRFLPAYRTGDRGFLDEKGILHFLGRGDNQIKLNGYRIEIGDIEENLLKLESISMAAVLPKVKDGKTKSLVAFVVLNGDIPADLSERKYIGQLKEALKDYIPEYMVPKKWHIMTEMPLNSNGKTDRNQLKELL